MTACKRNVYTPPTGHYGDRSYVSKRDLEDAALNTALAAFSRAQIAKALAVIADGKVERYTSETRSFHLAWRIPSASQKHTTYVVIDDGDILWCPCMAHGNCYHKAVAIMMRIHADHNPPEVKHRLWCAGNPETPHIVARSGDPVCCDLDVRNAANAYDPFAVFGRL